MFCFIYQGNQIKEHLFVFSVKSFSSATVLDLFSPNFLTQNVHD